MSAGAGLIAVPELRKLMSRMIASYRWCMSAARDHRASIDVRHINAAQGVAWLKAVNMVKRRIERLEKAECAAHKMPRRRCHVTRCLRCNALIEKEIRR